MNIGKYRASLIGVIAQALKGYIGHQAIISELLQNADDAGSSTVSLHFRPDRLEIHNNSYFTEADWNNIVEVASGGKHDEEGKIGTFGTGFISVYHITDQPEIFSSGLHITLNPLNDDPNPRQHPIGQTTVFHFPWRTKESELSRRIESRVWDVERIHEFLEVACQFIPEAFLFLRHVRQIDVFDDEHLFVSIRRTKIEEPSIENHIKEVWQIEQDGQSQRWLYYHSEIQHATPGNLKIKDRRVSIAFPLTDQPISGKLYNFLPTQIETGYAFHINGAFFPDNNRRGILDDIETNSERTHWNYSIIDTVADLLAYSLIDIRDQFVGLDYLPSDFYQLWPVQKITTRYNLVAIRERFIEQARATAVVFNSLSNWERPDNIWIAETSNLFQLASDYMSLLPDDASQIKTFIKHQLGAEILTLRTLLSAIGSGLQVNMPLNQTHPIINTRQRLKMLYQEMPQHGQNDFDWIREQSIFLTELETLVSATQLWRAAPTVRGLFKTSDHPMFADTEFESQWPEGYVPSFEGSELVDWLWAWEKSHPEDVFFDSEDYLKPVLEIIAGDIKRVNQEKLKQLYIVLAEGGNVWYSSGGNIFFAKALSDYELELPTLFLVKRNLAENAKARKVYETAGIQTLQSPDIVDLVESLIIEGFEFDLSLIQKLYRYFGKEQLASDVIERLKRLPIYPTAGERWTSLTQQPDLSLKPRVQIRGWEEVSDVLNKLQLDNFIHPELEREAKFLNKIEVKPLDELTFNHRLIESYYASFLLNDEDRFTLLEYLRDSVFEYHAYLLPVMQEAYLIRCADEVYRPASEVYLTSTVLDNVFNKTYTRPHSIYGLDIATNHDDEQTLNSWYRFFSRLGMLKEPNPEDVITRIKQLIAIQPNSASIEAVGQIFEYLNESSREKLSLYSDLVLVAWLPAQGDNKAWHLPSEIYEKRHERLIGKEAPILHFVINSPLKELLNLPERPDGELVARYLITCMQIGEISNEGGIYRHLGKYWNEVEPQHQHVIINETSIWDSDNRRFWKPDQCFIGGQEQQYFGDLRHYRAPEDGDIGLFYQKVGIQEQATDKQRLAFLGEITITSPLTDDKQKYLLENLRLIGADINQHSSIVTGCRQTRIVPDENLKLHRADTIVLDDQSKIREKFNEIESPFVHSDFTKEQIIRFWDAIGVTRLSTARAKITDSKGEKIDDILKQKLIVRIPHLRRIIYHGTGNSELSYDLNNLKVLRCDQLRTSYQVLRLESSPESEDVAFDSETNSLYVVNDAKNTRIALKLVDIMRFPEVVNASTIEKILDLQLPEIEWYLDELEYKRLPSENSNSVVRPEIPLSQPKETGEGDEVGEQTSHDILQEYDDEIAISDDIEEVYGDDIDSDDVEGEWDENGQRQYTGFGTGWGPSSHAPHFPNNPSEVVDRFGVEQEFPETPSIDFLDDVDYEDIDFDDEYDDPFENDLPDSWEQAFPNESNDTWSGLSSWFSQSGTNEFFRDAWNIQRELPKPEDRKGVFQIICEVFPQDGAVLYIDDIRRAVWKRRDDIAEGTISSILSRARPCFESLGNGDWAFHAKYIQAGYANLNASLSLFGRWAYNRRGGDNYQPIGRPSPPSHSRVGANWDENATSERKISANELVVILTSGLLIDLETFLHHIPADTQELQHDIIKRTAQNAEQGQQYDLSLVLYELLHKRGVKGFEKKIQELQQRVPLAKIAQGISSMPLNDSNRWDIWLETWKKYHGSIVLQDMIRKDILLASSQISQTVNEFIRDATEEVAQEYIDWLKQICPLWTAWHQDEMKVLGETLPLVFEWLTRNEFFDLTVAVIAQCPPENRLIQNNNNIDIHGYIDAVEVTANWLLQHNHQKSADVLRAFGLFVAKNSGQKLIDIKEYEQKVASNPVSRDDLVNAKRDEHLHDWVNNQIINIMIEQYSKR
ncbi:MAG: hypothetical protein RLP44_23100 [Aggregatilineales bacterium]